MILRLETCCYATTVFLLGFIAVRLTFPLQHTPSLPPAIGMEKWLQDIRSNETAPTSGRPLFSAPQDDIAATGSLGTRSQPGGNRPRLVGVVVTLSERLAVLQLDGRLFRVRATESFGSWSVMSIEDRAAILRNGAQIERLILDQPSPNEKPERGVPRARQ